MGVDTHTHTHTHKQTHTHTDICTETILKNQVCGQHAPGVTSQSHYSYQQYELPKSIAVAYGMFSLVGKAKSNY